MKILILDIETTPILGYAWSTYQTNIIEVLEDWQMICYAYKWYGEKGKPTFVRGDLNDPWDDREMVLGLWELFDEADILVGHNMDKFDKRKVNALFVRHGLLPPSPTKTIDTLKVARYNFHNSSNALNSLGPLLDIGKKTEHKGFMTLFRGCMKENDPKTWRTMKRYNVQDILLTERLYERLRPWVRNHPIDLDNPEGCTNCGSHDLQKRGFQDTRSFRYQRYRCNSCGSWMRGRTHIPQEGGKPTYV